MLNIGLSSWGHLGNKLHAKDDPTGTSTYMMWVIDALKKVDPTNKIYWLQKDRDLKGYLEYGFNAYFGNFLSDKRRSSYDSLIHTHFDILQKNFPNLDILILEWRMPISGRNCINGQIDDEIIKQVPNDDLYIQKLLLEHYSNTDTKIVILDLDMMCPNDIKTNARYKVLRLGVPGPNTFHLPVDWQDVFSCRADNEKQLDMDYLITYIGNNYDRDNDVTKWIHPISEKFPSGVHFYGNWTKYPDKFELIKNRWPYINYHDRITPMEFGDIYGKTYAVPLLAKNLYKQNGFMTHRFIECMMFGSLPLGLEDFKDIDTYLPKDLILSGDTGILPEILENISHNRNKLYGEIVDMNIDSFSYPQFLKAVLE